MGAKKQTIGYRYFMSLHMGIGRGPVNELVEIRVGDKTAYGEGVDLSSTGQMILINKPELFGGEKKEGGIKGPCYVYNGSRTQNLQPATATALGTLPSIASSLGGDVPSFRGVVTLWFDGLVCAMNPYPKEWSFRVRRHTAGWFDDITWYPEKAEIIMEGGAVRAMNGAHMLYELNTNPEWGRGMPAELLDENSYIRAANQLCNEGFGLCIPWFRQEGLREFTQVIIDHIGAAQYVDRETGKMTLRLIRDDYDPDDLPIFTPDSGLLELQEDDASAEDTAFNEIIIKGYDPVRRDAISVRAHNLASIQSQGEIISNTIEYRGLATRDLCARVAMRELKTQVGVRKLTLVLDRRAWRIAPGMPFRIQNPAKGIADMIVRASEITDGTLTDGKITIKAVQDVFGMPDAVYINPVPPSWQPPNTTAIAPPDSRMLEITYRDFYLRSDQAQRDAIDAGTSYIGMVAKAPTNSSTGYDLVVKTSTTDYDLENAYEGGFTAFLVLAADLAPTDTAITFTSEGVTRFAEEFTAGDVVQIGVEQMELVSINTTALTGVVKRGVADTIPLAQTAGSNIWLIDDEIVSDYQEYASGETVYGKALTRTTSDLLDIASAQEKSVVVNQRVFRPYPPANVKVASESIYTRDPLEEIASPVLTWAHRDRIVQGDMPVGYFDATLPDPEAGVSYRIRVYATNGSTLLNTYDAITGATWTYDGTKQSADGSPQSVWFEIVSVRDGVESHYKQKFFVVLISGWGYKWGYNWGGAG